MVEKKKTRPFKYSLREHPVFSAFAGYLSTAFKPGLNLHNKRKGQIGHLEICNAIILGKRMKS